MRKIGYNSQRDNFSFAGKFPGWAQCFSTCAWMFLSYYVPGIKAADDHGLMNYVDDVEATVGDDGIAEKVKQKFNWITGRTSLWWLVQKEAVEAYMWRAGIEGKMVFHDGTFPMYSLSSILNGGPVIVATNKIGGVPGGHIILLVDYDKDGKAYKVNDPYGNARVRYADINGNGVIYGSDWLHQYLKGRGIKPGKCRCMYWNLV